MDGPADPQAVQQKCLRFVDTYIQFVTNLSEAYPNSQAVKDALLRALNLQTSTDFVVRAIQLCQRWVFMVDENESAFSNHECAYLLASPTSVLADMEISALIADNDTWKLFREAFWTYIDQLTKVARRVVRIAPPINKDVAQLEQDARIIEKMESVGIRSIVDSNGRFGVDMSALLNMKDPDATVRRLKDILKNSGVDLSTQLPALFKSAGF